MRFTYTYRSSDGQRHIAEIEAESRDAAFAKVRAELGVKPIRVTAADSSRQRSFAAQITMLHTFLSVGCNRVCSPGGEYAIIL